MITIACSFTRAVVSTAVLGTVLVMFAPAVSAQRDESPRAIWMAGSGSEAAVGTDWGHLALRDGVLSFNSPATSWQLAVSEIKRASIVKSERLVVEGVGGEVYYVTILDARMTAGSPRDALKIIQRALRAPAARRE